MARYNYECLDCRKTAESIKCGTLSADEEWEIIYETSHPMEPSAEDLKKALVCPRCHGGNAVKTMRGCDIIHYVRGNGYLDKSGCYRDMNLHKLATDDPYADMRQPGEVEDLKVRLKRSGQHNPRTQYYAGGTDAPDASAE